MILWIGSAMTFAQQGPAEFPQHQLPGFEHGWFVQIPTGTLVLDAGEAGADSERMLIIEQPFWIGKYEVTQAMWEAVMGQNPSFYKGSAHPVENVSWQEVNAFIDALNQQFPAYQFRLPSEIEWEYACRSGSTTAYHFGETPDAINDYAWTRRNAGKRHHAVGQKQPNNFGLYDMHGNIWEWCADTYSPTFPASQPEMAPLSDRAVEKVYRGGSFHYHPVYSRSDYRLRFKPDYRSIFIGLRLVMTLTEATP